MKNRKKKKKIIIAQIKLSIIIIIRKYNKNTEKTLEKTKKTQ